MLCRALLKDPYWEPPLVARKMDWPKNRLAYKWIGWKNGFGKVIIWQTGCQPKSLLMQQLVFIKLCKIVSTSARHFTNSNQAFYKDFYWHQVHQIMTLPDSWLDLIWGSLALSSLTEGSLLKTPFAGQKNGLAKKWIGQRNGFGKVIIWWIECQPKSLLKQHLAFVKLCKIVSSIVKHFTNAKHGFNKGFGWHPVHQIMTLPNSWLDLIGG